MYQRDAAESVGMGVFVAHAPVSRPPRMADSALSLRLFVLTEFPQILHSSRRLDNLRHAPV